MKFPWQTRKDEDSTASTHTLQNSSKDDVPGATPLSQPIAGNTNRNVKHSEKANGNDKGDVLPHVTFRVIMMAVISAMGGFIFGYDTGQISGFLEMPVFLERFGEPTAVSEQNPHGYYFTNVRSGLIVGLLSIGTLIGCLIAGPASNKIGRKWSIPPWVGMFIIGVVIQLSVQEGQWVGIAMGRFVAGLGVGALSVLVPLYMAETSPVPVRGAVISCYQLFITIGIFTADCINYGTEQTLNTGSYRIPMAIGFIWALVLGLGILTMPETPRFDYNNGNISRAITTMSKMYGLPESSHMIRTEVAEIEKVRAATLGDHPWYEAFTGPRMLYRIALAMTLQMLQQLTGANYFFYYGTSVFQGVGIKNAYVTAMILGGVNVGSTFLGVWMARHCRRRESLYIAALWQFMCFMIFASVGQFLFKGATGSVAHTSGSVMIVFACFFIVGFATTWGPLVWACISELFPYRYRATGMAMATSANWFWNFMLAFFTPFITGDIQYAYGYVFAGCNLAAFVVVYFFLIESSGRTLEEVDAMYLLHVKPIKSRKFVFDEETRNDLGQGINTDAMRLRKGRNGGMEKEEEGAHGGVLQREGTARATGGEVVR